VPDLRSSATLHDQAAWDAVLLEGSLRGRGMAAFADVLSEADSVAIRAYVVAQAERGLAVQRAESGE